MFCCCCYFILGIFFCFLVNKFYYLFLMFALMSKIHTQLYLFKILKCWGFLSRVCNGFTPAAFFLQNYVNIFLKNGDLSDLSKARFGLLFYLYVPVGINIFYLIYKYSCDVTAISMRCRCVWVPSDSATGLAITEGLHNIDINTKLFNYRKVRLFFPKCLGRLVCFSDILSS